MVSGEEEKSAPLNEVRYNTFQSVSYLDFVCPLRDTEILSIRFNGSRAEGRGK